MNRFRLVEYKRHVMVGTVYVHARLQAQRLGEWVVVGVFQLIESEWNGLVELCDQLGVTVVLDVEESAVSS